MSVTSIARDFASSVPFDFHRAPVKKRYPCFVQGQKQAASLGASRARGDGGEQHVDRRSATSSMEEVRRPLQLRRSFAAAALLAVVLAACRSSSSTPTDTTSPADTATAKRDAAARAPKQVVAAPVSRYPDETAVDRAKVDAARACAVFSATMEPGTWIVGTVPAAWNLVELAKRGAFALVEWKPMGHGETQTGWLRVDCVTPRSAAPEDAGGPCSDAAALYGSIPCARQCYAPKDCTGDSRCIPTEPSPDVVGLCVMPDGQVVTE
jgi:hypothetical protein